MSPAVKDVAGAATLEDVAVQLAALCGADPLGRSRAPKHLEAACRGDAACCELLGRAALERLAQLNEEEAEWHEHAGLLEGLSLAFGHGFEGAAQHAAACDAAVAAVTAQEPRVRKAAARLLGVLASADGGGGGSWGTVGRLLDVVRSRLVMDDAVRLAEAGKVAELELDAQAESAKVEKLGIVHETEGWKGLETALLAIRGVVAGCGARQLAAAGGASLYDVDGLADVVEVVCRAHYHPNRFVREAALRVLNALVNAIGAAQEGLLMALAVGSLASLCSGLQDNWSQVRYVASQCARDLLRALPAAARSQLYPHLLPRMCLNRHYVAEGVRVMSQRTWADVVGGDGRAFLVASLPTVVQFYTTQAAADNHAVREAACQALAEVTRRLPNDVVRPLVSVILVPLFDCAKDASWPVRDHACRALADVAHSFPQATEASQRLPELYKLLHDHLADNIPSVRANCAEALVKACTAYAVDHKVMGLARTAADASTLMRRARAQTMRTFDPEKCTPFAAGSDGAFADAERNPSRFTGWGAAAKLARDNDPALHTNQVQYSCGSLAPKLRRGGGCMDHGFSRPSQPWEEADGGAYLWRALACCEVEAAPALAAAQLPALAAAARIAANRPFAHQHQFAEALWAQVAAAVPALPKACWDEEPKAAAALVAAVEMTRKADNARARTAAAVAMRALRGAMGFAAYQKALAEE